MPIAPDQIEMHAVPTQREGLCCHELDGEAVLYDPAHHALHYLNATAYTIWQSCDGHANVDALLGSLKDQFAYEGSGEALRQEMLAALSHLVDNGLIDWRQLRAA